MDGRLYALNATSGALLWSATLPAGIRESSPAVLNGRVYVGCFDGKVYAYSLEAGLPILAGISRPDPWRLLPNYNLPLEP